MRRGCIYETHIGQEPSKKGVCDRPAQYVHVSLEYEKVLVQNFVNLSLLA